MLQRMDAEILFLDPDDVNPGIATLIELGFEVEVLDHIDPYGPMVWIKARITTELDAKRFFHWINSLVEPLQGWLYEAGRSDEDPSPRYA
jgi:hypothetical protein